MGGWELQPFNKYFYPPKPKKGFRKLEYYSQFFDSIEVNATYHNASFTPVHARQWLQDVGGNKEFMFTVKLYQGFTHTFDATSDDVTAIHRLLEPIANAGKLGGLLIQFPYRFTNLSERRLYLVQLSKIFQRYRMFLEVRHNSWNSPAMYNFFQENKYHLVNVDLPPMNRHMPLTSLAWDGAAYFRMMGRNMEKWNRAWRLEEDGKHMVSDRYNYYYSERELANLLYYIKKANDVGNTVYVVFHNDPEANSLINGFQLRHLVRHKQRVLIPENLVHSHPELKLISSEVNVHHPLFAEVEN
jgi:uncharacterized protein YecE (DUF72 family)